MIDKSCDIEKILCPNIHISLSFIKKTMIKSMTGFGKCVIEERDTTFTVEIRALNSKQLDVNLRMPVPLKEHEIVIRSIIGKKIQRGKVDVSISTDSNSVTAAPVINQKIAEHYYIQLKTLSDSLNLDSTNQYLPVIVKMPDVLVTKTEGIDDNAIKVLMNGVLDAIAKVDEFRISEGVILEEDFNLRIDNISLYLTQIEQYEENRLAHIFKRIKTNLESVADDMQLDKNRLEQEMIYYVEKLDITEEKVRLKKHCDYFIETMQNEDSPGKKLSFISQEIGREINTIGSKANDADIQKLVVLMKDELEKIKEQIFNIL